jgi:hypothetical protein
MPGILTNEERCPAPAGIERLYAAACLDKALLVEDTVCRQKDFAVNVPYAGLCATKRAIHRRVIEPVAMELVEPQSHIERGRSCLAVLATQVLEQLIGGEGQVAYPTLEEVAGQRGLGRYDKFRRLSPSPNLSKEGAKAAEVLLIRAFVGTYLGNGEAEHARKVRGERCEVRGGRVETLTSYLTCMLFYVPIDNATYRPDEPTIGNR